jgi:hypothetical protein
MGCRGISDGARRGAPGRHYGLRTRKRHESIGSVLRLRLDWRQIVR